MKTFPAKLEENSATGKRVAELANSPVPRSAALSARKASPTAEAGGKKCHFRPLPKEFRRDGFSYRQIAREGDTAIYEQVWLGCAEPSPCYELIRIHRRDGFQIGKRFVEPAEVYPNSDAWGTDAFTFTQRDAAFAKLRELA